MQKLVEEEAKAVTNLIKGVKIIVPFVISIVSIVGVYYAMEKDISDLQKDLSNEKEKVVKLQTKVESQERVLNAHAITLSEVTTDIKHIKDDTKETLDLVRTLYRLR
jgi:predicted RNase H-like nuclease (RuvC/YqgF family)